VKADLCITDVAVRIVFFDEGIKIFGIGLACDFVVPPAQVGLKSQETLEFLRARYATHAEKNKRPRTKTAVSCFFFALKIRRA